MSLQSLVTKELLFAYFDGQVTVLQKRMIEKWIEEGSDNEEFFYACLHEWEMQHPQFAVDTDEAIVRFNKKILEQNHHDMPSGVESKSEVKVKKDKTWRNWIIAASVLLVLQFCAWLNRDDILYKNYTTSSNEINNVVLADGSQVVLNANSLLKVPRFGFGELSRNVYLSGEARFSVVHTPDHKKFTVSTDSVFRVEVLGTEFSLSARNRGTKVVLLEGKVKVLYKQVPDVANTTSSIVMAPGDLVTVDREQKKLALKQVQHPENYSAWQHGQYVFDNTSLAEIKDMLQANYGLEVELKGTSIAAKTVSGSFKAKNADELLQALSEIFNINILRKDEYVLLVDYN